MIIKSKNMRFTHLPDYAIAPGATLLEMIQELGIDQKEFAERTNYTQKHISQIIHGKAPITADAALRFENVTGVPAHFWNNLESLYREKLARMEEMESLKAETDWLKAFPLSELIRRGVLPNSKERTTLLKSLLSFFGVATVASWKKGWTLSEFAFRKSTAHLARDGALAVWLRLGEIEATKQECSPYDAKRFRANLESIRLLTLSSPCEFLAPLRRYCAEAGVALALIPEVKGAPVSGAAKWLTPAKAMICLNLRGKSNDRFWFTFFHEAAHLLNDAKSEVFLDFDYNEDPREKGANLFARNVLISPQHARELPNLKSPAAIQMFAKKIGIHPGIVVGRLQHEGILPQSHCNGLKSKWEWKDEWLDLAGANKFPLPQ